MKHRANIEQLFTFLFIICLTQTNSFNLPEFCKADFHPKPPANYGECDSEFNLWYYDISHPDKCSQLRGACSQGDNRFATREECQMRCVDQRFMPVDIQLDYNVCFAEMQERDCRTDIPYAEFRDIWFYNKNTGVCERCKFSGRKNFPNRFLDESRCLQTCVASPLVQATWKVRSCLICHGPNVQCANGVSFNDDGICKCMPGFYRSKILFNGCEDIDECQKRELNQCPDMAQCQNTIGGYTCGGYLGPGFPPNPPWMPTQGPWFPKPGFPTIPWTPPQPYIPPAPFTPYNPYPPKKPMQPTTSFNPYYPSQPYIFQTTYKSPAITPPPYIPKYSPPPIFPTPPPFYTPKPYFPSPQPYLFTPSPYIFTPKSHKPYIPDPYVPPKVIIPSPGPYWPTNPPYIPPPGPKYPMVTPMPFWTTPFFNYWTTPRPYWTQKLPKIFGGYLDRRECELRSLRCDQNANCFQLGGSFYCKCNEGLIGNGYQCNTMNRQPTPVDPYQCEQFLGRRCNFDAECMLYWPNQYSCQCRFGFFGDGYYCHRTGVTPIITVHPKYPITVQPKIPVNPYSVMPYPGQPKLPVNSYPQQPKIPANPVYPGQPIYPVQPNWKPIAPVPDFVDCRYKRCDPNAICKQTPNSTWCECMPGFAGNGDACTQDRSACNEQFDERYRRQCGSYNFQEWFYLDLYTRHCKMFWFGTCAQAHGIFGMNIFSDEQTCVFLCNAVPNKGSWPQPQINPIYPQIPKQPVPFPVPPSKWPQSAPVPYPYPQPRPYPYPQPQPKYPYPQPAPYPYPQPQPKYPFPSPYLYPQPPHNFSVTPFPYPPYTPHPYRPSTPFPNISQTLFPSRPVTSFSHKPMTPYQPYTPQPYRPPYYPQSTNLPPYMPYTPMPPVPYRPGACTQPCQPGPCNHVAVMYYYNPNVGQCQPFVYGGCGGNQNKFSSLAFCQVTCQSSGGQIGPDSFGHQACLMRLDQGFGRGDKNCDVQARHLYYFNYQTRRCEVFFYYGCGGNGNKFANEFECQRACQGGPGMQPFPEQPYPMQPKSQPYLNQPYPLPFPAQPNPHLYPMQSYQQPYQPPYGKQPYPGNVWIHNSYFPNQDQQITNCHDQPDIGPCRNLVHKWFFDARSDRCEQFTYGGCYGNGNRYETQSQCEMICRGLDPCSLPVAIGTCKQHEQRFYFDPTTQNCYPFEYTGCGGNANNFYSYHECKSRCTRKKV